MSIEWLPLTIQLAKQTYALKCAEDFLDPIEPATHLGLQSARRKTLVGVSSGAAVAELDCEIARTSPGGPTSNSETHVPARSLEEKQEVWFSVWVAPSHRRKGIGLQAIQHLRELAMRQGFTLLVGAIEPMNTPSQRLTEKAGFTISAKPDEEDGLLRAELNLS